MVFVTIECYILVCFGVGLNFHCVDTISFGTSDSVCYHRVSLGLN